MCVVVDANVIPLVFNDQVAGHESFEPVKRWIYQGHAKLVWGGKSYLKELGRMVKYLRLFNELRKGGKVDRLDDEEVDAVETKLIERLSVAGFNDHHMIAIVNVSGCRLICSNNARHFDVLTDASCYAKGKKPKVYCEKTNPRLLNRLRRCGRCSAGS